MDESTDINNICQLLICIHGHVAEQAIFDAIKSIVDKNQLASISSDEAKVMRVRNEGLLGILKKNEVNYPAFHCVIHQQALFSKEIGMNSTMNIAVKIINKIRDPL